MTPNKLGILFWNNITFCTSTCTRVCAISANLAQNRLRLIHDVDLYMGLYGSPYWTGKSTGNHNLMHVACTQIRYTVDSKAYTPHLVVILSRMPIERIIFETTFVHIRLAKLRSWLIDTRVMSDDRRPRQRLEANPRPSDLWSSALSLDHDPVICGPVPYPYTTTQ